MFSKKTTVIFYILIAIVAVVFFARTVASVSFKVTTELLEEGGYDEYTDISGIALRNETVLYANNIFSSIFYYAEDGDRVAKSTVYAVYNETAIADSDQQTLLYLKRKISQLDKSLSVVTQYDSNTIEKDIKSKIINQLNAADESNFYTILKCIDETQISFNKKTINQNGASYLSERKSYYEKLRTDIYTSSDSQEISLRSPSAGYFYSQCDGYEYINVNNYSSLTVSDYYVLDSLQPTEVNVLCVGKLQNEPVWKFAAIADTVAVADMTTGSSVALEFDIDYIGSKKVTMTVEFISRSTDGKTAIIFRCNTLNDVLFSLRKESCRLILNTYKGLKVDNEALRIYNNETGVFVLSGQRVIFKPVNVLCVADTYSIVSSKNTVGSRLLKVKDEIIINGKDLYDGKIVNNAD